MATALENQEQDRGRRFVEGASKLHPSLFPIAAGILGMVSDLSPESLKEIMTWQRGVRLEQAKRDKEERMLRGKLERFEKNEAIQSALEVITQLLNEDTDLAYQLFLNPQNKQALVHIGKHGYSARRDKEGNVILETTQTIRAKHIPVPVAIKYLTQKLARVAVMSSSFKQWVDGLAESKPFTAGSDTTLIEFGVHVDMLVRQFQHTESWYQIHLKINDIRGDFDRRAQATVKELVAAEEQRVKEAERQRLLIEASERAALIDRMVKQPDLLTELLAETLVNVENTQQPELQTSVPIETLFDSSPIEQWHTSGPVLARVISKTDRYLPPTYAPGQVSWMNKQRRFVITAELMMPENYVPTGEASDQEVLDFPVKRITVKPTQELLEKELGSRERELKKLTIDSLRALIAEGVSFTSEDLIDLVQPESVSHEIKLSLEHVEKQTRGFITALIPEGVMLPTQIPVVVIAGERIYLNVSLGDEPVEKTKGNGNGKNGTLVHKNYRFQKSHEAMRV